MAVIDTHRPAFTGFGRALNIRSLFATFSDWRLRNASRKALLKLSDEQLTDIGLERVDVERLAFRIMH